MDTGEQKQDRAERYARRVKKREERRGIKETGWRWNQMSDWSSHE